MRVQSDYQYPNGGWRHWINEPKQYVPPPFKPTVAGPPIDFTGMHLSWAEMTDENALQRFAAGLGVSSQSLSELCCAWAPAHWAWAFPMRSPDNKVIGIRLRNEKGQKWAVTGSKQGLFIPQGIPPQDTIYICEGPTDTAAVLTLGLYAVGRASCMVGGPDIAALCRRLGIRQAVIVVDNDENGAGERGAAKLSKEIGIRWTTFLNPCKDIREWVNQGNTREVLDCVIRQSLWSGSR